MRRELLWAALWLWAGIALGLFVRPATGQSARPPALLPVGGAAGAAPAPSAGTPDLRTHAGLWYDIAATPDRFHEGCHHAASTRYVVRPDASLQVINRCRDAGGRLRDAEGVLRPVAGGRLQLGYAPGWLAWLPLAWSEVRVIDLDASGRLAVLATPDLAHLWVLARDPVLAPADYEALLARLRTMGVATEALRRFPRGAGMEG